jgi:tripartite-type tricarboxylate transporter receptor subunit TctC
MIGIARAWRTLALSAATALFATLSNTVVAQTDWPTNPVTMVVPFAPGGSTDVVARLLGQKLSEMWGQNVVIDNRAGAGGNIGTALVAKAPADGHTLLMASGSILTVNPHLYAKLPFEEKDLEPITNVASSPMVVVIPASMPYKTLKEFIDHVKANPGKLSFGSAGVGSQVHMAGENFLHATGLDMVHVPYRGEAPSYTDLMGGQIHLVVGNMAAVTSLLPEGRMRPLAVTSTQRSSLLPDVPTVAEAAVPGFENAGWFGLVAPAGTPKAVIEKIQRDTAKVLQTTEMKARLHVLGMTPVGNTPEEFKRAIAEESRKWADVVKARNLKAN